MEAPKEKHGQVVADGVRLSGLYNSLIFTACASYSHKQLYAHKIAKCQRFFKAFYSPHSGCSKLTSTFPLYGHRLITIVSVPITNFLYFSYYNFSPSSGPHESESILAWADFTMFHLNSEAATALHMSEISKCFTLSSPGGPSHPSDPSFPNLTILSISPACLTLILKLLAPSS